MSRSGYVDDLDPWPTIMWRGQVASAIRGRRGQAFLRELIAALDALPEKKLISNALEDNGAFCALGAVGHARGIDLSEVDTHDHDQMVSVFGIADQMIREIEYLNDEAFYVSPEERWVAMRKWAAANLKP